MSNRDDKIKELTNRLNHLRLQRREIARKEQGVYHQLRIVVFGPAPPRNTAAAVQAPLPDEVRSGDSEGSENELSNGDTEAPPPPTGRDTNRDRGRPRPITDRTKRTPQERAANLHRQQHLPLQRDRHQID